MLSCMCALGVVRYRALMFVNNQFAGVVPDIVLTSEEHELLALVNREMQAYVDNLENIKSVSIHTGVSDKIVT